MCENEDVYAARVWGEMREKLTKLTPNYKKNSDFSHFVRGKIPAKQQ
jgi:hypothetical protein